MTRVERDAELRPGLYAFGTGPLKRLTAAEEAVAPFENRLRSAWRYLVKRAKRWIATLSDRERAHVEAEDLLNEIVIALLERDHKWRPERGGYVTFAEQVARNVLSAKREQARVVDAPSNALGRLKVYRKRQEAGTLGPASALTMRAIECALGDSERVGPTTEPTYGDSLHRERDEPPTPVTHEVVRALRGLDNPTHALVLGKTFGLYGGDEQSTTEIAADLGSNARTVYAIKGRAKAALRRRIEQLRKPTEAEPCSPSAPGSPTSA